MTLLSLYAAFACCGFILASLATDAFQDIRPRFLREADTLPARGIVANGVATLPLLKTRAYRPATKAKRQSTVQVPLADQMDGVYGVALDIGGQTVTFQLDTGSSDLWSITQDCMTPDGQSCSENSSVYSYIPSPSFQSLNLPLKIEYGSEASLTFASGTVGMDSVTFGGLSQSEQAFAPINTTNNSIVNQFSGIFGIGLPFISNIMVTDIEQQIGGDIFSIDGQTFLSTYFSAVDRNGPLVTRMASSGQLKEPMYTLTMQREEPTMEGSNAGVMTLGGLPSGISNDSLTWVPVKSYPTNISLFASFRTVQMPSTLVDEVTKILAATPFLWEVVIDGLFINGQLQQNSSVAPEITNASGNGLTALFDSGTTQTLITRNDLQSPLLPSVDSNGILPCSTMYNISFGIAGKQFPINPFDLILPAEYNDIVNCQSGIAEAAPPTNTSTYSYLAGDAFFRSNLVAFYWGNLTDQTSDPARIGFLSTVNVAEAESDFSSFWRSAETASPPFIFPTEDSTPQLTTTSVANPINSNAGIAAASGGVGPPSNSKSNSAMTSQKRSGAAIAVIMCSAGLVLL